MAVRKRFSAEERALLASGQAIEVQNVTQWHAATIAPGAEVTRDAQGWERIAATIDATRGTVRAGDPWPVSPGHLRARPARPGQTLEQAREMLTREARAGFAALGMDPDTAMSGQLTTVPAWHGQPYPADAISHARAAASWLTGWPASDD